MTFHINAACWNHYDRDVLQELMAEHPFLFPNFQPAPTPIAVEYDANARKDEPYTDPMGCTWVTTDDGITGTVKHHPLEDWKAFGTTWHIPDPNTTDGLYAVDWSAREKAWSNILAQGQTFRGSLRHGHTFLQLCDLRGYENLMFDMADEEPLLFELIDQLTEFNLSIVKRCIRNHCASMSYPEDLGMQVGPMLSPSDFRKYIKPCYEKLIKPAKDAGIPIHIILK